MCSPPLGADGAGLYDAPGDEPPVRGGPGAPAARAEGLLDEVPTIDRPEAHTARGPRDPFAEAAMPTPDDRGTAHQG